MQRKYWRIRNGPERRSTHDICFYVYIGVSKAKLDKLCMVILSTLFDINNVFLEKTNRSCNVWLSQVLNRAGKGGPV